MTKKCSKLTGLLAGGALALVGLAGPAVAAPARTQRFTFIVRLNDGIACTAIATGPITGVGSCDPELISESVTVVHVSLPSGGFDFTATAVGGSSDSTPQACIDRSTTFETFVVTGVSGAYVNATGSGTDTVRTIFTARRAAAGCVDGSGSGLVVVQANGTAAV